LSNPVVLHLTRPYANVEEYLAAEAWTLDTRSMLLIDEPELPIDTMLTFAVTLADGSRPIKAEARVAGTVAPSDGKPGGLRVRFKRYGAPTKAFIERAMALVASGAGGPGGGTAQSLPQASGAEPSSPEPSIAELSAPIAAAAPVAPVEQPPISAESGGFHPVAVAPSGSPDAPAGLSSLRARSAATPETPPNREVLLEKLRQRGQSDDVTMPFQRT
jgi:hypothetical protein